MYFIAHQARILIVQQDQRIKRPQLDYSYTRQPLLVPPNGLRYLLAGEIWIRFEDRIPLGCRKSPKMPQNPASQVHALLGGVREGCAFTLCGKKLTVSGAASLLTINQLTPREFLSGRWSHLFLF